MLRRYVFVSPQGCRARTQIAMWSGYQHGFCVQDLTILQDMHEPKCENFSSWTNYSLPSCIHHMGRWKRRAGIKPIKMHCNGDGITPLPQGWSLTHRSTSIRPLKQRGDIQLVYQKRQLQVELTPLHPKNAHLCRIFFAHFSILAQHIDFLSPFSDM